MIAQVSSGESSAPPAVHQRTNSAGLDNFFGASSGDVPAPQVAPTAAAPASSGSGTGDLFGSPAAAALPADNFAAFGDFAPAPKPPADNFADFAAAPSPAPTPAPALDDDFFGFSGAQAPQPPAANSAGKPSGNLFSPPQAPATAPKSTGLDDLFGFADSAPAEAHPNAHGRTQGHPMADSESAAISAMRQREAAQDALEAEKMMFVHEVEAEVVKWGGPDYDPKNIRALLAGFHVRESCLLLRPIELAVSIDRGSIGAGFERVHSNTTAPSVLPCADDMEGRSVAAMWHPGTADTSKCQEEVPQSDCAGTPGQAERKTAGTSHASRASLREAQGAHDTVPCYFAAMPPLFARHLVS